MAKKSKEEIEYIQLERYERDMVHFLGTLMDNGYAWKECSEILLENNLLVSEHDIFDKRKNETVTKKHIPSTLLFRTAMKSQLIFDRNWETRESNISYVTVMDIINRAKVLQKYPRKYVEWADKLEQEWMSERDKE